MIRDNQFYKCLGHFASKKFTKPVFFYHVPKCGGTTFCVILSHIFKKSHRLKGPLFENNDKGGVTGYQNYLKDQRIIQKTNLNFLYGHVPFEIHNQLEKKYLFITILRDPIKRCLSHYTWALSRGFINKNTSIDELFKRNIIPSNAIVNQFSGIGLTKYDSKDSISLALKNLKKNIDYIVDIAEIFKLLNLIISKYNLPNIFFQNQQVQNSKIEINQKTIDIIEKYNTKDILLYKRIFQEKINKNYFNHDHGKRNKKEYLFSSPNILYDNKKTILINEKKFIRIEKKLNKLNYKILIK